MGKSKNKGKGKAVDTLPGNAGDAGLEEIKASLKKHNDSFSHLLGLIPAKFYLHDEDEDADGLLKGETSKGKKLSKNAKRQLDQEQQEEITRQKKLAKKAKYDPTTPRTVLEIQAARAAAKDDDDGEMDVDMSGIATGPIINHESNGEEDSPNDTDFEDDESADEANEKGGSIDEIRARLQARIAQKQKSTATTSADAAESKATSRDALLEERRKKRAELRDKRRQATKERKKQERESGIKRPNKAEITSSLPPADGTTKAGAMSDLKKQLKKAGKKSAANKEGDAFDQALPAPAASSAPSKPATSGAVVPAAAPAAASASNAEPNVAFSSLDFTPSSAVHNVDAPKMSKKQRLSLGKSTKTGVTSHDPKVALEALNKRQEFLSKLTPAARERAEEKDKWERMDMRAAGTKVYDEEAKLKKMVKRKEKAKDKSRKDWADRKETVANAQAAAIKKRQDNINARLQQRKDKKMGVKPSKSVGKQNPKKKGRPGFEGRGSSTKK